MKFINVLGLVFAIAVLAACNQQTDRTSLETTNEKISYAIGLDIGNNLRSLGTDIDIDILVQAIRDTLERDKSLMTQAEMIKAMQEFSNQLQAKDSGHTAEDAEKNRIEGEAFLSTNQKKPGVTTTASGLQYKIIKEGGGPKPAATDEVTVHYRGTLIDGTEFDSSYKRDKPATFPLNGVIAGWTEGLQLMNKGSKFEFYIPSELAYGSRGAGDKIGPNATLIFEVELLSIAN